MKYTQRRNNNKKKWSLVVDVAWKQTEIIKHKNPVITTESEMHTGAPLPKIHPATEHLLVRGSY